MANFHLNNPRTPLVVKTSTPSPDALRGDATSHTRYLCPICYTPWRHVTSAMLCIERHRPSAPHPNKKESV